jgi:hypothetical protein
MDTAKGCQVSTTSVFPYTVTMNNSPSMNDYITISSDSYSLEVKGDANFHGDIKVKGKDLVKSLELIEERLAILHPNTELEEKWEQLCILRNQYIKLEQEIKDKEKVWNILKK